jgi:type IV pilus assembly protein PilM
VSKPAHLKGKNVLAIDFGSHSLKFVSGKLGKDGFVVHKMLSMPISTELYNNGELLNTKELGALVQSTIVSNGFKNMPVICTISGPNCVLRVISLPQAKQTELAEMVRYEIQQFLPVDVAQYVIQYSIFKSNTTKEVSANDNQVLIGAVPRAFAEGLYQMFLAIDIQPFALDLQVHSMSKLISFMMEQPTKKDMISQTLIFVDIGHTQMDISVYEEGHFYMNRRVASGGMQLDQKISRVFDVSLQDAQLEKHQVADISKDAGEYSSEHRVQNVVQSSVDEWAADVSRVAKFYVSRSNGKIINQVFLYGGSSQIKGLDKYFTKELGIETHCLITCSGIRIDNVSETDHQIYFNAFGALIRREEQK